MSRYLPEQTNRRSFIRNCAMSASSGALFGVVEGMIGKQMTNAAAGNDDTVIGNCIEEIYRDADSCAYLIELSSGEITIGLGPANLDQVSCWEPPELIDGNVPSVIYHPMLSESERRKLEYLLPRIA